MSLDVVAVYAFGIAAADKLPCSLIRHMHESALSDVLRWPRSDVWPALPLLKDEHS